MVKLAYLCGAYPRATDTFIQREIKSLRGKGYEVSAISVRQPIEREFGTHEQDEERKRTFYLLPCSPFRLISVHLRLLFSSPLRYFTALHKALSIRSPGLHSFIYQLFYFAEAGLVAFRMRKDRIKHIHNHAPDACGYVAMIASFMGDFTYSMTLHGFGIFAEPNRWRLKEKLENCLFAICISRHGISQAMLSSDRRNWNKFHLVHCGVTPLGNMKRKHKGVGKNLLFVGRLDHVKGLPNLIEAFYVLAIDDPELHLHIVGDGPERSDLESLIREKKLDAQITIYGYKSQSELKTFFVEADVFVMTSFFEGIPTVIIEAFSYGVPVVVPRITGVPELVQDGVSGFLITPADTGELAEAIRKLLDDPDRRNSFSEEGRKKVEEDFNLDRETDRFVSIMQKYLIKSN